METKSNTISSFNNRVSKSGKFLKIYHQLVGLLFFIYYQPKVNKSLRESPEIFSDLLILLSILYSLENDILKIKSGTSFFSRISSLFSNLYKKDLQIDVFKDKLTAKFILERILTLKVFLSNLTSIQKEDFDRQLNSKDLKEILENKYDFKKLIGDTNILVTPSSGVLINEQEKYFPLPLDKDINDTSLPKRSRSQEVNDPYKPIVETVNAPSSQEAKQIVIDKLKNDPNFYPFLTKPKIIIYIKRFISAIAVIAILWTIGFLGYVALNSDLLNYFNKCIVKAWGSISASNTIIPLILVVFVIWIPIYIRAIHGFLFIPKLDKQRYNFPVISSFFSVVWGVVILFSFNKFWIYFFNSASSLSIGNDTFVIISGIIFLFLYFTLLISLIVGIYKRPKVDVTKIINLMNQNQTNNNQIFHN